MKKIKYKLALVEDKIIEGDATRIQLVDEHNVLTISNDCGPIIQITTNGKLVISLEGSSTQEYAYSEGILKAENNLCSINLLK